MNEHADTSPHMRVTLTRSGTIAVLSVSGEVDLSSAPVLEDAVLGVFDEDVSGLIVDLSDVDFLASTGMAVLMELSRRSADLDFAVVAQGRATAHPLELLGLDKIFAIHPGLDAALAALTTGPESAPE